MFATILLAFPLRPELFKNWADAETRIALELDEVPPLLNGQSFGAAMLQTAFALIAHATRPAAAEILSGALRLQWGQHAQLSKRALRRFCPPPHPKVLQTHQKCQESFKEYFLSMSPARNWV